MRSAGDVEQRAVKNHDLSRRRLARGRAESVVLPPAHAALSRSAIEDIELPSLQELEHEFAQTGLDGRLETQPGRFPWVLTLDVHGVPHRWINWQQAVWYYARERVAWEMGETAFTVHGGKSKFTGEVSSITSSSIIAVKGKAMAIRGFNQVQPLSNRELFRRDRQLCAYCGSIFQAQRLTRDHVQPLSRGGLDTWMNVVTACRACNQRKGNHTLDETSMELLYAPYVPNRAEFLILANRRILADQMEFLKQHVSATSRVHLG
jgi:hypothetical protein